MMNLPNRTYKSNSVLENASYLVADKVVRYGLGFFVGISIARHYGPSEYGLLNYSLAIIAILLPLIGSGVESIVLRTTVASPEKAISALSNFTAIRVLGSIVMLIASVGSVLYIEPGNITLRSYVTITALGSLCLATDSLEVWLQSTFRAKIAVISKSTGFFVASIGKLVVVFTNGPLIDIIYLGVLEAAVGAVALIYVAKQSHFPFRQIHPSLAGIRRLLADGWILVATNVCILLSQRFDQILIARYLGNEQVGIYSAAFRFTEFAYAIPTLLSASVLPVLTKYYRDDSQAYGEYVRILLKVCVFCSIVLSAFTFLVSSPLIHTFFGPSYDLSTSVLKIQIWSSIFVFLTVASSQHLIVVKRTDIVLARVIVGMIANLLLNVVLVPWLGIIGSAYASVLSSALGTITLVLYRSQSDHIVDLFAAFNPIGLLSALRIVNPFQKPSS